MASANIPEVRNAGTVIDPVEIHDITNRLNEMAGELSCFQPVITRICDEQSSTISAAVCGQLEMISSLSERINFELSQIALDLRKAAAQ